MVFIKIREIEINNEIRGDYVMKIAIIGDSSKLYMPYVDNYQKMLNEYNIDYTLITWDRLHDESSDNEFTYIDKKKCHKRNFIDYFRYSKFVIKRLYGANYDKLIVCGIPLAFFLKEHLLKHYKKNYIIDIRDYNKILKIIDIDKLINNSYFTVISSPGYKEWLPINDKYIINHNTQITTLDKLNEVNMISGNCKIKIAFIGATRDYDINIDFINSLKNDNNFEVYYHGEGDINSAIEKHLLNNDIKNVYLTGRYTKDDELNLYKNNNIINVLRYNDEINNKTALPNRLYNAVIFGKPIIAFTGTYLAEIVKKYEIGLVINSFDNIGVQISNYLSLFNVDEYKRNREVFIKKAIEDNSTFSTEVTRFIFE